MSGKGKRCKGYSRYNDGTHERCDRDATGNGDGTQWCDIHREVARTDPFGTGKNRQAASQLETGA